MKIIIWMIVIWIVVSLVYGRRKGELDFRPFVAEYKHLLREHLVVTIVVTIIVAILLFKILF